MQLTYRGQAYNVATPAFNVMPSAETATFLGQPYPRKQFTVAQHQQPAELIYRCVRYAR
jgi:hypothetical protein